jgi:hypothetical protein
MYATGVTYNQLREIAEDLGIGIDGEQDGNRARFTLKVNREQPLKFRKFNPRPAHIQWDGGSAYGSCWTWYKANAICFHGHWDFIEAVLETYPNAKISSSRFGKVNYTAESFVETATAYGDTPLGPEGNIYHDFQMRDCCQCEHELHPVAGR